MDSRLEELRDSLQSAVEGMTVEQLSWHPPGKWSAAQILEHLYLSYAGTIRGFEKVLETGSSLATPPSLRHRVRTLVVIGLGYMPEGRRAPDVAKPKGIAVESVRSDIGAKMKVMDCVIAQCEARFGSRVRLLDHPIMGPLTAPQWRKLHIVHGWHHRKQILRLREGMKK